MTYSDTSESFQWSLPTGNAPPRPCWLITPPPAVATTIPAAGMPSPNTNCRERNGGDKGRRVASPAPCTWPSRCDCSISIKNAAVRGLSGGDRLGDVTNGTPPSGPSWCVGVALPGDNIMAPPTPLPPPMAAAAERERRDTDAYVPGCANTPKSRSDRPVGRRTGEAALVTGRDDDEEDDDGPVTGLASAVPGGFLRMT